MVKRKPLDKIREKCIIYYTMATKGGRPENLVTPSTEKAREIGRKGGIKSGQVRREKKMLSEIYGEILAELYKVDDTDDGKITIDKIAMAVLSRADSASVALLKEMREATEGNKLAITGEIKESKFEYVDPPKQIEEDANDV